MEIVKLLTHLIKFTLMAQLFSRYFSKKVKDCEPKDAYTYLPLRRRVNLSIKVHMLKLGMERQKKSLKVCGQYSNGWCNYVIK